MSCLTLILKTGSRKAYVEQKIIYLQQLQIQTHSYKGHQDLYEKTQNCLHPHLSRKQLL